MTINHRLSKILNRTACLGLALLLTLTALFVASPNVRGEDFINQNFDALESISGSDYSQNFPSYATGFVTPSGNPVSISEDQAHSGAKSVLFDEKYDVFSYVGDYENGFLSFWFYLTNTSTIQPTITIRVDSLSADSGYTVLTISRTEGDNAHFTLNNNVFDEVNMTLTALADVSLSTWHKLTFELNDTYEAYYEGSAYYWDIWLNDVKVGSTPIEIDTGAMGYLDTTTFKVSISRSGTAGSGAYFYIDDFIISDVSPDAPEEPELPDLDASFEALPTSGMAPLEVTFTPNNLTYEGYNWTFGDGNTSEVTTPTHTYSEAGTYNITLNVTSGSQYNESIEVITVTEAPAFTSSPITTGQVGAPYSYQATCSQEVDLWDIDGAIFLEISSGGLVTGTPGEGTAGTYNVSISATVDATTIYQNYSLEIGEAPAFTSSPITTGYAGFGYSYQPTTSEEVISWSLTGGGASLYINETTGLISSSGLGAIGTTYTLSITATIADGELYQNYTLTVVSMFTSSPDTTGKDAEAYSYQVVAREEAIDWTIIGPDWLSISETGLVTGTPPLGSDGIYNITVQVRTLINEVPAWSSQDYALTVYPNAAYAITSDPITNATADIPYEYQITSRYVVIDWNITGADWLSISETGLITGTAPNDTLGSFNISVRLLLYDGSLIYQNYTLEVEGPPTSWADGLSIAFGLLAFLIVISAIISIAGSARRRY